MPVPLAPASEREEEPTCRADELEEVKVFLASIRRYAFQAEDRVDHSIAGWICEDEGRMDRFYGFQALIDLDLIENCVRAARKSLRSSSFVANA
jgi:hypothetical protein